MLVAGFVFGVEDETMGLVDGVESFVTARVVGMHDVADVGEIFVE